MFLSLLQWFYVKKRENKNVYIKINKRHIWYDVFLSLLQSDSAKKAENEKDTKVKQYKE